MVHAQCGTQTQKILAVDGRPADQFGYDVSIDGTRAIVGARYSDINGYESGEAYVYRLEGSWVLEDILVPNDPQASDEFGFAVSISGDWAVVGARGDDDRGNNSGSAYVFRRSGSIWSQHAKLVALDGGAYDLFGSAVSITGDLNSATVFVGAPEDDDLGGQSGSAYVFRYTGSTWTQTQKLTGAGGSTFDYFGASLAVSGNYAVVGSRGRRNAAGISMGAAYPFRYNGSSWVADGILWAPDALGYEQFGNSVDIDGTQIVVGAYLDGNGSAYAFQRGATSWTFMTKLVTPDGGVGYEFGTSVGVSGGDIVVGAPKHQPSGAAYWFVLDGSEWRAAGKMRATDEGTYDWFGNAVDVSQGIALVGAFDNDDLGMSSGSAYFFECTGSIQCSVGSDCVDGNSCTSDSCSGGSCSHANLPNGGLCDNGNGLGTCQNGVCVVGGGGCVTNADCADGLYCNGTDTCVSGACVHSGNPCPGPDGDAVCAESCNEASDNCTLPDPNGSACTDGLYCNGNDSCFGGSCSQHAGNPCPGPDGDSDCTESCYEAGDNCTASDPNGSVCNDGNAATTGETCNAGICTPPSCNCPDEGNPCTNEVCSGSVCTHPAKANGTACNDNLFCNGTDTCSSGVCAHSGNPCPGPDGDANCAESCDETNNNCAASDPAGSSCNDGLYCNGADSCSNGSCGIHAGNPCPGADGDSDCSETCNESTDACTANDPNLSVCNDGNSLTTNDRCTSGICAGTPSGCVSNADCNDNNPCTTDSCVSGVCQRPNNTAPCNDSVWCNGADTCSGGSCSVHAGNPCPGADGDVDCSETCNEATDACTANDPNLSVCNDGNSSTTNDRCTSGVCVGTAPQCTTSAQCNDNNPCTTDSCVSGVCQRPNNTAPCNDGAYCNGADTCGGGTCSVHAGNPCPGADGDSDCSETCNEATDSCTANDPNGSSCGGNKTCNNGSCRGGQ